MMMDEYVSCLWRMVDGRSDAAVPPRFEPGSDAHLSLPCFLSAWSNGRLPGPLGTVLVKVDDARTKWSP